MAKFLVFTHKCTGHLGLAVREEGKETRVVAQYFFHRRLEPYWTVYDIVKGGALNNFTSHADALNAMLDIGARELGRDV